MEPKRAATRDRAVNDLRSARYILVNATLKDTGDQKMIEEIDRIIDRLSKAEVY